ncbi:hypothetical protein BGX29_006591 [Mortierella sp. GBA35]|nr:hypothetical protein BGX29_006591 [Mortierella sp. GBA35]
MTATMNDHPPYYDLLVPPVNVKLNQGHDQQQFLMVLKLTIVTSGAAFLFLFACYLGFLAMVTAGCLLFGGMIAIIVQSGLFFVGSNTLLPMLVLSILIAYGVGLVFLLAYVEYLLVRAIFDVATGRDSNYKILRLYARYERWVDRMAEALIRHIREGN